MKKVYIAHPLAGDGSPEWGDQEKNVERYLKFIAAAMNKGYCVFSWVHHYLTHTRGLTDGDPSFYLERDAELIKCCDELWLCGPVDLSKGMIYEAGVTRGAGITVVADPLWLDGSWAPVCSDELP